MARSRLALDCETFPIGKGAIFPKVVCVSFACLDEKNQIESFLCTDGQANTPALLSSVFVDPDIEIVGLNTKYDLACIKNTWPELTSEIWQMLADGRVTDVTVREKLLNLSSNGMIDAQPLPDGSMEKMWYSMEQLARKYLGLDLTQEKNDPDSWRMRFPELTGKMPEDYPEEARTYSLEDAEITLMISVKQDEVEQNPQGGPVSMNTQYFQTACDFALAMYTENGFHIDPEAVQKVEDMLDAELAPANMKLLIESKVLRPASGPQLYKNGAKNPDGTPKMTKAKNESVNKKNLMEIVKATCEDNNIEVKYTDSSEKYPDGQIATSSAVIEELAPLNPILEEFRRRQAVMKLRTSYIPNLLEGIVYAPYDILKETGRTSSKKDKLFPSWNGQQVDPRVRQCCVARPGHVIVSADYSALELVSLGQKVYDLFGHSTLRDLILKGVDPHAYLGAQMAYHLDKDVGFKAAIETESANPNPMMIYHCFMECKKSDNKKLQDFFAHYRKLAKPVGLGYPGGLGPQKCMEIAHNTYGIEGDLELFTLLREIWYDTFPEMRAYFKWINESCQDPNNPGDYCYKSPLGMYRAGASYCAAANGAALQTPSAEGAKGSDFDLARECCDPAEESILLGCRPLLFIHDENLVEIPEDELMHERAMRIGEIMEIGMGAILEDMPVKAEPCLMYRWDKRAEPVFDANGRLIPWEPEDEADYD